MTITERRCRGFVVLDLSGALVWPRADCTLAETVRRHVLTGWRSIVINLAEVCAIDAAGLGALVAAFTRAREAGGSIVLAGLRPRVRELVTVTGLIDVFDTCESVEDALSCLNAVT
jgi:anti-sigma B factor antagonist